VIGTPGIGESADGGRDARHDFERDPLFVQEQRFRPPLSNTNGSPHFNRATVFPSALSPRSGSRWRPVERLWRRRADVDALAPGFAIRSRPA
jgi:hypothetical protein